MVLEDFTALVPRLGGFRSPDLENVTIEVSGYSGFHSTL